MAQLQFNAMQYEPMGPAVENWPDGWVLVVAKATEVKPNAGGQSGRLSIQIEALEGPMKGKQHYIGLNIYHDNPQTVEIAYRQLSSITHVTLGANKNQFQFNNTDELCNIPFYVLAANKTDDKGKTRTNFDGFRDARGNEPKGNGQGAGGGGPSGGPPAGPGGGWNGGGGGQAPQGGPGNGQPQGGWNPGPGNGGPAPQNPNPGNGAPVWNGGAPQGTPQNGNGNNGGGGAPAGGWDGQNVQPSASPSNGGGGGWNPNPPNNGGGGGPAPQNGGGWNPGGPPQGGGGGPAPDNAPWRR